MANVRKGNVQVVDTSGAFPGIRQVKSILYVGAAASSVTIKSDASTGGTVIWERNGATELFDSEIRVGDCDGLYVTVTGTAKVYLYLG